MSQESKTSYLVFLLTACLLTGLFVALMMSLLFTHRMSVMKMGYGADFLRLQEEVAQLKTETKEEVKPEEGKDLVLVPLLPPKSYKNDYYGFSFAYPPHMMSAPCLNDFCEKITVPSDVQLVKFQEIDGGYLEISMWKNKLGMPFPDFAKKSFAEIVARPNEHVSATFEDVGMTTFKGYTAFSYIANGAFEERGSAVSFGSKGPFAIMQSNNPSELRQGLALSVPHRVAYFDANGFAFRIIFPENSKTAKSIIESLSFKK